MFIISIIVIIIMGSSPKCPPVDVDTAMAPSTLCWRQSWPVYT